MASKNYVGGYQIVDLRGVSVGSSYVDTPAGTWEAIRRSLNSCKPVIFTNLMVYQQSFPVVVETIADLGTSIYFRIANAGEPGTVNNVTITSDNKIRSVSFRAQAYSTSTLSASEDTKKAK